MATTIRFTDEKRTILFLVWLLLSLSLFAYAEPPIEVIYFKPSDVQMPSEDEIDRLREAMVEVQSFFASEMDKHGFGRKTFDFDPDIVVIDAKLKLSQYTSVQIHREISLIEWGLQNQIYVVFLGGATGGVEPGASAVSKPLCVLPADLKDCNSMIVIPANNDRLLEVLLAHELGHSFSLFEHAPTRLIGNRIGIMYAPLHIISGVKEHLKNYALSRKDATFLNEDGRLFIQEDSQDSNEDIDADVNAVPDLVAYYPFDRSSEDASGNGNHGQIIGTTNYVEGKFGDAIALNNGVYVKMDASDSLHGDLFKADPFTLAVWVYPKTGTAYGHVWRSLPVAVESGTNTLFIIEDKGIISWRGRIDGEWSYGDLCETDPGLFEADTWVHVAVTNDGDKFRIYVDGEKVAETDFQETDGGNTAYLIGSRFTSWENFVGLIDDYVIFSKALNKDEINLIMKTSVATFLQTTQSAAIEDSGSPEDVNGDGTVKKNNTDNDTGDRSDTVSLLPMSVPSPNIGQLLKLSIKITNGKNVAGYQATVQFDDTALRYVESSNSDYLPDGAFFVPPILEGNLVKLNAASLAGESKGNGTLATLTFEVIAVQASTLTLSDVLLSNSTGETFAPQVENSQITEPTKLIGDVNGDGTVNIADLVLVASNLGQTGQNAADVNSDGVVNIADLVLVAGALGTSASPSVHPQILEMLTATDVKQWLSAAQRLNLTDMHSQRGIRFLQQLLVALTPKETALLPNFPNPFNPETWIPYHLAQAANVTLTIYDVRGVLVRALTLGHQPAGVYQSRGRAAYWDGKNQLGEKVASGLYFYTLAAGDFTATRKMLIQK
ncbi:MAG: dockerin type I domain-containing protein [Candidatus Poribacteria bacterium]|nr:dockerin type I domain-containing protein [Candidatus Poribacteria bacterium]